MNIITTVNITTKKNRDKFNYNDAKTISNNQKIKIIAKIVKDLKNC